MKRRNFLKNTSLMSAGIYFSPTLLIPEIQPKLAGFLFPLGVDQGVNSAFNPLLRSNSSPDKIINEALGTLIDRGKISKNEEFKKVSLKYKDHYEFGIKPNLDSKALNGEGYYTDTKMKNAINDYNDKTSTPVHSVKDLLTFNHEKWLQYCDLANLQISSQNDRLYVRPLDNRKPEYKGTWYIDSQYSYMLYNPAYYCYGLPIENPTTIDLQESDYREMRQKTNQVTNAKSYVKQRFYFNGEQACQSIQGKLTTIYWGLDEPLKQYLGTTPIQPCGDPGVECDGDKPQGVRPSIRS
ncbi:hypothetical protein [Phaeodactylibacter sp.]|uniref:hypothetical protein n=1 Tax=Phaeodactylibacter sp. TaxID=1940289 RepID=UPI0025ECCF4C|nr:hypothetical protein [Phaeodactylibacter sp.]MCI4651548.1 hypothetical protein [Phaeodactylibacter sp.]MCI5091623.1 hypothetical protein [Phaeodactylibacter sp.]